MLKKEETVEKNNTCKYILTSKCDKAVKHTKTNKVSGIDEIPVEFIKKGQVMKNNLYYICMEWE